MTKPRARDLGVPFDGTPGPLNAITDVAGVEVGHTTLDSRRGEAGRGERAGPHRRHGDPAAREGSLDPVFAAWFPLNGNGELTGAAWIDESGLLEGPLTITNTHSVGVVRDAVVRWLVERDPTHRVGAAGRRGNLRRLPQRHQRRPRSARTRLRRARGRQRRAGRGRERGRRHRDAGVRVQGGDRHGVAQSPGELHRRRAGSGQLREARTAPRRGRAGRPRDHRPDADEGDRGDGSAIVVVATDAPLLPHQLRRLAKRAALGLARTGSIAENTSGDLVVAFSTANRGLRRSGEGGRTRDAAERPDHAAVRRDRAGHGGSGDQRAGRRGDDDGHRRPHGLRPAARPFAE